MQIDAVVGDCTRTLLLLCYRAVVEHLRLHYLVAVLPDVETPGEDCPLVAQPLENFSIPVLLQFSTENLDVPQGVELLPQNSEVVSHIPHGGLLRLVDCDFPLFEDYFLDHFRKILVGNLHDEFVDFIGIQAESSRDDLGVGRLEGGQDSAVVDLGEGVFLDFVPHIAVQVVEGHVDLSGSIRTIPGALSLRKRTWPAKSMVRGSPLGVASMF